MSAWGAWIDGGEHIVLRPTEGTPARLFVREAGAVDGPPTLLLHGFPTHSLDWARIAPRLSRRRLIMPDLLGFGASDKPRSRYSFARHADLIQALLAQKGVNGALAVVAHDYSVTLLQELLAREAEGASDFVIERAVFLNGGIYGALHRPVLTQKLLLTPLIGSLVASQMTAARLRVALTKVAGPDRAWTDEDAAAHFEGLAASDGLQRLPALLHYIADRRRFASRWQGAMERAGAKLSFVWGEADPVSGAHMLDHARRRTPSARVVSFADVGHYPHWEAPDLVGPAIARLAEG